MSVVELSSRHWSDTQDSGVGLALAIGASGSLLLAVSAWLAGPVSRLEPFGGTPLAGLRELDGVRQLGTLSFFTGITLLCIAWMKIGPRLRARPSVAPRTLMKAALLWSGPLILSPPLASRDAYSYLAQGFLDNMGSSPYEATPAMGSPRLLAAVSETWTETPTPYGPIFTLLMRVVASVSGESLLMGIATLRAIALAALALSAWLLTRLVRRHCADASPTVWLVVLNPLVLLHGLSGLHNEVLLLPFLLAAVMLADQRRPWLVGILLGFAGGMKMTALVPAPFLIRSPMRQPRNAALEVAKVGLASTGVLVGAGVIGGYGLAWLVAPRASVAVGSRLSLSTSAADALAGIWPAAESMRQVIVVLTLGVAAALVLRLMTAQGDVIFRAGAAAAVVAASGPLLHPWYFLPPLALLLVGADEHRNRRRIIAVTCLLAVLLKPEGGEVLTGTGSLAMASAATAAAVLIHAGRFWAGANGAPPALGRRAYVRAFCRRLPVIKRACPSLDSAGPITHRVPHRPPPSATS